VEGLIRWVASALNSYGRIPRIHDRRMGCDRPKSPPLSGRLRLDSQVAYMPRDLYIQIERSVPITCVDFVPVRRDEHGCEVGLILRDSPFGQVWCHLGGRVQRGETLADAIRRHTRETLGVEVDLGPDPQPLWVYQWFPDEFRPQTGLVAGHDPRKHAIALSFVVDLTGKRPEPRDEALDFAYYSTENLPDPLWPGCEHLIRRLVAHDRNEAISSIIG